MTSLKINRQRDVVLFKLLDDVRRWKVAKNLKNSLLFPGWTKSFSSDLSPYFFFFLFCFCSPVARDKIDVPLSVKVCYSFHRKHNELISSFMSHFKMSASFIRLKKKKIKKKRKEICLILISCLKNPFRRIIRVS